MNNYSFPGIRFVVFFLITVTAASQNYLKCADRSDVRFVKSNENFNAVNIDEETEWEVGFGRRIITPQNQVWLAGYGTKRAPEGKIHDLWVKVMAIKDAKGRCVVMATTDHMGMSRTVYDRIFSEVNRRFKIKRTDFMLTFSHNHCGPCIVDDLVDYYPSDEEQRGLVEEYTRWMEQQVSDAVGDALTNLEASKIYMGEGICTFAVNRRENPEAEVPQMIAEGRPFKGAVDHYVPVLAIKSPEDELRGILFGYACHPTTLSFNYWCGDFPGFAQINLEERYSGANAMFFNACGADQNPLPRRTLELCENYGSMLSDAVEDVLKRPMTAVSGEIRTAFKFVDLYYEELVTREKLAPIAAGKPGVQQRWAQRMIKLIDEGTVFSKSYEYPVQTWSIGRDLLLIAIGGESVVDYSLMFKNIYGEGTWVCGYTNEMISYIPSRRVWEEGGYEGRPHLDEYGHPAWRWRGDVEDRISETVRQLVRKVRKVKVRNH